MMTFPTERKVIKIPWFQSPPTSDKIILQHDFNGGCHLVSSNMARKSLTNWKITELNDDVSISCPAVIDFQNLLSTFFPMEILKD